jgi:hypothetical protein
MVHSNSAYAILKLKLPTDIVNIIISYLERPVFRIQFNKDETYARLKYNYIEDNLYSILYKICRLYALRRFQERVLMNFLSHPAILRNFCINSFNAVYKNKTYIKILSSSLPDSALFNSIKYPNKRPCPNYNIAYTDIYDLIGSGKTQRENYSRITQDQNLFISEAEVAIRPIIKENCAW